MRLVFYRLQKNTISQNGIGQSVVSLSRQNVAEFAI